jgi:two-component system CheB/CheR fusion protein
MAIENNPCQAEQDAASDASKPTVVGIGASAGGLAALKKFFENVPADSGLVFVVIVHLSPEHKSLLADLLQPHVRFSVQQVSETTPLERNRVYVIPPNANLSAIDTHLRLSKLEEERRERAPIDHFFRTLAATHDGHAVGVVLTGTGSDGTLGIREIKAKGGIIIVQDPNEAEFDGMPQSAIATGMVDMILPITDIPQAILRFHHTHPNLPAVTEAPDLAGVQQDPLPKVLGVLRARTDRDFSRYKRATLLRRIMRRMQLNYLEDFESYLARVRENPEEARALADDLLITVTSFFRDPEVFRTLEKQVLPEIFEHRGASDSVRVWSVGCATGEEAYSLAMLMVEEASRREAPPRIQVFASDLHKHSLDKAREGFYPGDIETDVNAERLRRFFHKENGGYRISKELRELVVFAPHNLLSDPPFSRLDLIACRNLLIYLEREVQREVVELFHYSLCPGGHLLLGSAEVVDASELFRTDDKKLCLYRKRNVPPPEPRLPVFPMSRGRFPGDHRTSATVHPVPYGELHQRLVERFAPPSILVSAEDKVVHLSEHAGRFLLHPGGEMTASVSKLVREELRIELRSLLQTAHDSSRPLDSKPILVQFNGHARPVVMRLRPSGDRDDDGLVVVIFDEREPEPERVPNEMAETGGSEDVGDARRADELQEELHQMRQRMQATIEEFESSQEEMKASNEEMQSTNEELRSTLEELETSKEELQSINEELQTVNQENRHKVEELSQLSSDLHNLLAATDIATLFLDRELRILRFTPKLGELFNVRQTDRGRPISDLTTRIGYPEMRGDASHVLQRLTPIERELQDESGRWYLTHVLPYRSAEDRIEGVVITFVDITSRKLAEEGARASEERLAAELEAMRRLHSLVARLMNTSDLAAALRDVLESAVEITGADMGVIQLHNRANRLEIAAHRGFEAEFLNRLRATNSGSESAPGRALATRRRVIVQDVMANPLSESQQKEAAGNYRAVQSTPLVSRTGRVLGVLSTFYAQPYSPSERDLRLLDLYTQQAADYVDRRRAEEEITTSVSARQASERMYQQLFDSIDEGFCVIEVVFNNDGNAHDYRFLDTNPAFEKNTGLKSVIGKTMRELAPAHEPLWFEILGRVARSGAPERFEGRSGALDRYFDAYAFRTGEPSQRRVAILLRDVSERKAAEERQAMLLSELNHRVKNTLTTVQSIANQTMVTAPNAGDFVEKFRGRITTLAEAHDLLAQSSWEGAELTTVIRRLLAMDGDNERVSIFGPLIILPPQTALSLSLVIYELGTNARKYGALSQPQGRLRVTWQIASQNGKQHLDLDWIERGGPPVAPPEKTGFGRTLIEQALKGIGGETALQFEPGGITCRILLPVPPPPWSAMT